MKIFHSKKKISKQTSNIKSNKELTYKDYQNMLNGARINKTFDYFLESITFDIETSKINTYMISMISQDTELDLLMRGIEPFLNNSMTLKEQNMFKLKILYSYYH